MALLNKLLTGHVITDEVINRASSTAAVLAHDTIRGTANLVVRTGAGGTGTLLSLTTDYTVSAEDTRLTTEAGITIYTKLAIVNATYQNVNLYVSYKSVGDYAKAENLAPAYLLAQLLTVDGPTSGLDAQSASGAGIGSAGNLLNVAEANTVTGDGVLFRTTTTCAHAPAGAVYWSILQTYDAGNALYKNHLALGSDGSMWYRTMAGGTWNTPTGSDANGWVKIFTPNVTGLGCLAVSVSAQISVDVKTLSIGGCYNVASTSANLPGVEDGWIDVLPTGNIAYRTLIFTSFTSGKQWKRRMLNNVWDSGPVNGWHPIWSSYADGNIGQQPAPKPTTGTPVGGADAPGQVIKEVMTAGTAFYHSGSVNKTGTWDLKILAKINASGLTDFVYSVRLIGSGVAGTVAAGETYYIETTRQS